MNDAESGGMTIPSLSAILRKQFGSGKVSGHRGVPSYLRNGYTKNQGALCQHLWFTIPYVIFLHGMGAYPEPLRPLLFACGSVALHEGVYLIPAGVAGTPAPLPVMRVHYISYGSAEL